MATVPYGAISGAVGIMAYLNGKMAAIMLNLSEISYILVDKMGTLVLILSEFWV
jgi:hypothetical protein